MLSKKFRELHRDDPNVVRFLPEPERRKRDHLIISVDDHLIEPPDAFDSRVAEKWRDHAPKLVVQDDGSEAWLYEGKLHMNIGMNAVAGRPIEDCTYEPQRFSHMRRGAYDVHARIRDMDLDGVYASLCFPSGLVGFGGQRLQMETKDPELALAMVQAVNSWHLEAWAGAYPDRLIPLQIPYLLDVEVAAAEVRRNAAARVPCRDLSRGGAQAGAAVVAHRPLGTVRCGVRRDRHGDVPAHRVGGRGAFDCTRRAGRCHRSALLRHVDVRGDRLAVLAVSGEVSKPQAGHVLKAA